jgi:aromatic ring-opening dioxygenase catalytic subunit (LigB family)
LRRPTQIEVVADARPSHRQPTIYIPHGGGPCFFMDWDPPDTWHKLAGWLRGIPASLPEAPKALLVVSGHWEERVPTVLSGEKPPLFFDYYGFPEHTYQLKWPAPGSPELAARVRSLLGQGSAENGDRGFDHGVFVPLKVAFPDAAVPTVQLSLRAGLDPAEHLAMGRALQPLRDEGVLIIGSGMSYHNMRGFMSYGAAEHSKRFSDWLAGAVAAAPPERDAALTAWAKAPSARESHPREEHLMPLMVAAGAAGNDRGHEVFRDQVMGATVLAARFG